jgi:hypothetical protein
MALKLNIQGLGALGFEPDPGRGQGVQAAPNEAVDRQNDEGHQHCGEGMGSYLTQSWSTQSRLPIFPSDHRSQNRPTKLCPSMEQPTKVNEHEVWNGTDSYCVVLLPDMGRPLFLPLSPIKWSVLALAGHMRSYREPMVFVGYRATNGAIGCCAGGWRTVRSVPDEKRTIVTLSETGVLRR